MSLNTNRSRDRIELETLKAYIQAEFELETQIIEVPGDPPVDSLAVMLEPDENDEDRAASLIFIPVDDEEIQHIRLLQFFLETSIQVQPQAETTLLKFLSVVNLNIPVGAFMLNEDNRVVYKYVLSLGKANKIDKEEFLETFVLWLFSLDNLTGIIYELVDGQIDLAQALSLLDE